jgi:hypothetical protein
MKRLFIFFSLCIFFMHPLMSQVNNFGANISYLMKHLDFTEVTSGLLADRSVPFVLLDSFDGQQLLPVNEMDVSAFGLMYATLYGAALDSTTLLPHPDAYMGTAAGLGKGDTIPFAILHYDYHRVREDALTQNLLEVIDSQLYDVPNRPQSPYPTNS